MSEKLFALFCIENDFAQYLAKCCTYCRYFVLKVMVIPQYTTGQIKFPCNA